MDIVKTLIIRADKCDAEKQHPEAHCYRKAADEIIRLQNEIDRLKCAHSDMAEMYRKSQVKLEAARVDAERYRFIRGGESGIHIRHQGAIGTWPLFGQDADAAIDAAITREHKGEKV